MLGKWDAAIAWMQERDSKGCNGQDVLNFPFIIVAVFDRLTIEL